MRAAPIGCPEESPLPVTVYANFAIRNSHRGIDAPTPARVVGLPPRGGEYFLSKRKKVPKKASGTATPEAAHVAMRRGLRSAGAERLDAPNLFGASNSGP